MKSEARNDKGIGVEGMDEVGYMLRGDFSKEEWEWLCDEYQISHDTDLIELHFTGIE